MSITLGNLKTVPIKEHMNLLADPVAVAISNLVDKTAELAVVEIDPSFSDTSTFCEHYKIGMDKTLNCVILQSTRGDRNWFAACIVQGNKRADVNGLARRTLDARKVSFAPMEMAVSETGMEYGGISPIGLPPDWPILIDSIIPSIPYVVVGSGIRKSKIIIPGFALTLLPNAQVVENLGR